MIVTLIALVGCVEDVSKDKVEAIVEDVAAPKEARKADGTAWAVDVSRSKLMALGAKISATHPITFGQWDGSVTVADGQLTSVEYTVQMETLAADIPKLTKHLKNEDFFDVAKFPTSTFRSTSIAEGSAEEGMTHTVTGELTIRGATKQVTFPAKIAVTGGEASARTQFAIDRRDFGVVYPGRPDDLVQDKVLLTVELVAPKPAM